MAGDAAAQPLTDSDTEGEVLSLRRRVLHLAIVDTLVLGELTTAMYLASRYQDQFTLVFLAVFVGLLIPTLLASRLVSRRRMARCQESGSA